MPRKKVVTESKVPIVEVLWQDAIEIGEIGWNDLAELRKESRKPCAHHENGGVLCVL